MENPIRMDDLGGKPTIFGNTHIGSVMRSLVFHLVSISRFFCGKEADIWLPMAKPEGLVIKAIGIHQVFPSEFWGMSLNEVDPSSKSFHHQVFH